MYTFLIRNGGMVQCFRPYSALDFFELVALQKSALIMNEITASKIWVFSWWGNNNETKTKSMMIPPSPNPSPL